MADCRQPGLMGAFRGGCVFWWSGADREFLPASLCAPASQSPVLLSLVYGGDACQQAWVLRMKHGLSAPHPHWKSDANESWTVRPCRRTCGGDKDVMTTAGDGRVMGGGLSHRSPEGGGAAEVRRDRFQHNSSSCTDREVKKKKKLRSWFLMPSLSLHTTSHYSSFSFSCLTRSFWSLQTGPNWEEGGRGRP